LDDSIAVVNAIGASSGVQLDMSSAADADNTGTKGLSVTTGAGNDSLTGFTSAVTTVISSGAGNDVISVVTSDTSNPDKLLNNVTIDAGEGNDTITLTSIESGNSKTLSVTTGAGSDTVTVFGSAAGSATAINVQINDFTVGAAGDVLDLSINNAVDGGTASVKFQNNGSTTITALTGLYVKNANVTQGAAATSAQIAAGLTTTAIGTDNDIIYIAYDDGTNTYIAQITNNGAAVLGDTTAVDEVAIIATLVGVSDATTLTVSNFADFLA